MSTKWRYSFQNVNVLAALFMAVQNWKQSKGNQPINRWTNYGADKCE